MTEWWQRGEDDVVAPVPRRDQVPTTGFSAPSTPNEEAELTRFIPAWRVRRRVIAIGVSVFALGEVVWSIADIVRLGREGNPAGAFVLIPFGVKVCAAGAAVFFSWRWANRPDMRDVYRWKSAR